MMSRQGFGLDVLRLVLCAILFTHGVYRFYEGSVPVFGEILGKIGFPTGVLLAYCVNIAETVGTVLTAKRWLVVPICVILSLIYVTGIMLFHRHWRLSVQRVRLMLTSICTVDGSC